MPYKIRRMINAAGGLRIGETSGAYTDMASDIGFRIGNASTYAQTASTGVTSLAGCAQVWKDLWIPAEQFYFYSASVDGGGMLFDQGSMLSACLHVSIGGSIYANTARASLGFPVLQPAVNITASPTYAHAMFAVPTDVATTGGSLFPRVVWTTHDAHATSGSVSVFGAAISYISSSALVRKAASTAACATYNYTASGNFHETSLGSISNFGSTDVAGVLTILSDQVDAADTTGSGVAILGVKLRYVSNILGASLT